MKAKITLLTIVAMIIVSCHSSKKAATSPVSPAPVAVSPAPPSTPKSSDGIYPPGNEELVAIQSIYKDVTLDQLTEGHKIYAQGACVNCHRAKNIYRHDEIRWKTIMDDMAKAAKLSDNEKNSVYKYVLAIKATQPK